MPPSVPVSKSDSADHVGPDPRLSKRPNCAADSSDSSPGNALLAQGYVVIT